jgi:hypothetical protein
MAERKNGKWLVGRVGVDAGMVMVGDPCYLDKYGEKSSDGFEYVADEVKAQESKGKFDYSYSGACAATLSENSAGELGLSSAVAVSSGYGDGVYPVYATYNGEGRIVRLEVSFDSSDEEEDVEDDEETTYTCVDCGDVEPYDEGVNTDDGMACKTCVDEKEKEDK